MTSAFSKKATANIRGVQDAFRWQTVLAPLADYVRDPWPAPDRELVRRTRSVRVRLVKQYGVRYNLDRMLHYLRQGGWAAVADKVRERLRSSPRAVTPS